MTDNKLATDHIRYDILARDALRGVLRQVLADTAAQGLPGEHHFYITFNTTADGVQLSPRLLAQYPQEITIILQHQFWDLRVSDDEFEVGLSFNGIPEHLVVPFSAIKSFFDPSVQFGLQFETIEAGGGEDESEAGSEGEAPRPTAQQEDPAVGKPDTAKPEAAVEDATAAPGEGAQVVQLDRFRKK